MLQSPRANIPQSSPHSSQKGSWVRAKLGPRAPEVCTVYRDPSGPPSWGAEFSTEWDRRAKLWTPQFVQLETLGFPVSALPGTGSGIQLLRCLEPRPRCSSENHQWSQGCEAGQPPLPSPTFAGLGHMQAWTYTRILTPPPAEHFLKMKTQEQVPDFLPDDGIDPKSCTT